MAFTVEDGRLEQTYLLIRSKRVEYNPEADNRVYVGQAGDNLFSVAARHFRKYPRPASLFWLVGEYQPVPVLDPTTDLTGRELVIPPDSEVAAILRRDETSG